MDPTSLDLGTLRNVLLVRIASAGAEGVTRATVRADLAPMVEHRLSPAAWRRTLDELVFIVLTEGFVVTRRMRLTVTPAGREATQKFLGIALPAVPDWGQVRDVLLIGRALGIAVTQAPRRKKLENAQGLRGAILEYSFGLPAAKTATITTLRDTLARRAVPKTARQAVTSAKSPRSSRRAVERLLRRPREFASDAALLAELAAEQVGAQETSVPSLRKAILRKLVGRPGPAIQAPQSAEPVITHSPQPDSQGGGPMQRIGPSRSPRKAAVPLPSLAVPPDLAQFAAAVLSLARACAEGWAGNRRAYIAAIWQHAEQAHADWVQDCGLSTETFKARLIEAHKAGHLMLAYADLRSKETIALVQASAVRDRNNEWHFVRIDD